MARGFRGTDYVALLDEVRADCPRCARRSCSSDDWDAFLADGDARQRARARRARGRAAPRRPDQHPVHVGHDRRAQGRDALAPQHPQQRLLQRPRAGLQRARPRLRAGALLPLLRDGARQPRLRHPRRVHRRPGRVVRRRRGARDGRGGALHVALRRADDVHRRARRCRGFERFDLSSLRTGIMGGAPCPVEVMKQVRSRMHMERGRDRLRHDRDLAAVDADGARRPARQARRDRRPRAPARRDQGRRPGDGRDRAARDARRAVHARLQRDARLLERPGRRRARRSTPTAGCTPATSR